jgi:hypothetical protein
LQLNALCCTVLNFKINSLQDPSPLCQEREGGAAAHEQNYKKKEKYITKED